MLRARVNSLLLFAVSLLGATCSLEAQRADLNADGYVDVFDATLVATCISTPPGNDPRCARADVEVDGDVDAADLTAVTRHFGAVLFQSSPGPYTPASVHIGRDGIVYLFDQAMNRIHRWSLPTRRPLAPIPLGVGTSRVAYSREDNRLYVAYGDRRIVWIDAAFPTAENPFATASSLPRGMEAAGR